MIAIDDEDAGNPAPGRELPAAPSETDIPPIRACVGVVLAGWVRGDLEAAVSPLAEDCVYVLHAEAGMLPEIVGTHHGRAAVQATLARIAELFEVIVFRPFPIVVHGNTAHTHTEFMYRHRASGEVLTSRMRHVWVEDGGFIVRVEEYHDRTKLDAFLRMVTQPLASDVATVTASVLEAFHAAWATGDFNAVEPLICDNAIYSLNIDDGALEYGGTTEGRPAIMAVLHKMRADFDYLLWRPMHRSIEGETGRDRVEFVYRHRASGELLSGRFRLVWTVNNGCISSCAEYQDKAMFESFLRLFGTRP